MNQSYRQPLPQCWSLGQSIEAIVVELISVLSLLFIQQIFIDQPLCAKLAFQGINQKDPVSVEMRL